MKVIINIGHPAHVHFFKYFTEAMLERGHEIRLILRQKEIGKHLLDHYGFNYTVIGSNKGGIIRKAWNLVKIEKRLMKIAKEFNPDIIMGISDLYGSHVGKILDIPSIVFSDNDDAKLENFLFRYFCNVVCTPSLYKIDYHEKHVRYNGFHELAYLHPKHFKPDISILDELGVSADEKIIVVRFASWRASHDVGKGVFNSMQERKKLINTLEKYGKVIITSEISLPKEFEKNRFTFSPEKIHSLLWYSTMYVGEGLTMATESAILGTPSVVISPRTHFNLGNHDDLKNFELIETFSNLSSALPKINEILGQKDIKSLWSKRRRKLLNEKIDVTNFIIDFVERYPQSFRDYCAKTNS